MKSTVRTFALLAEHRMLFHRIIHLSKDGKDYKELVAQQQVFGDAIDKMLDKFLPTFMEQNPTAIAELYKELNLTPIPDEVPKH